MKLMFVSDIHGSLYYCRLMQEIWQAETRRARLILFGALSTTAPATTCPGITIQKGSSPF